MTRRSRRSVPAVIVALCLVAAAVVVGVSYVQSVRGTKPILPMSKIADYSGTTPWDAPQVGVATAVIAALGLLLLYFAIAPGRPSVIELNSVPPNENGGVSRKSLERALETSLRDVDAVDKASVHVSSRAVRVKVRSLLSDDEELSTKVRAVIEGRLDDISLTKKPNVKIAIKKAKDE